MRFNALPFAVALILITALAVAAQDSAGSAKKKVNSANDLPRFSYPISSPPSVFLLADDATFNAFAEKVIHDVDSILSEYDIADKATLAPTLRSPPELRVAPKPE